MKLHINYLHIYTAKLNCLRYEFMDLQEQAEITADQKEVENFIKALDDLKTVVNNIPTVKKAFTD